jgi:hypothetical protein
LRSPEHHIRCFEHILNLAAQDVIYFIGDIVKQIRVNLKFIRQSPQNLEKFEKICEFNNEKFMKPELDCKTRWNSTFTMLNTAVTMSESINFFIEKESCKSFSEELVYDFSTSKVIRLTAMPLSKDDWDKLVDIMNILGPFQCATVAMCAEKLTTRGFQS